MYPEPDVADEHFNELHNHIRLCGEVQAHGLQATSSRLGLVQCSATPMLQVWIFGLFKLLTTRGAARFICETRQGSLRAFRGPVASQQIPGLGKLPKLPTVPYLQICAGICLSREPSGRWVRSCLATGICTQQ